MLTDKEIAEIEWRAKRFHAKSADVEKLLATVKELRKENTEQRELLGSPLLERVFSLAEARCRQQMDAHAGDWSSCQDWHDTAFKFHSEILPKISQLQKQIEEAGRK